MSPSTLIFEVKKTIGGLNLLLVVGSLSRQIFDCDFNKSGVFSFFLGFRRVVMVVFDNKLKKVNGF